MKKYDFSKLFNINPYSLKLFIFIVSILFLNDTYCLKIRVRNIQVKVSMEYPYTCGTWFNRGKNTCNEIIQAWEKAGFIVDSKIQAFHQGEFPNNYNGEFNIHLINQNSEKSLIATSDKSSKFYHSGLKYFSYTFYRYDNGDKNYLESFPQKDELLKYVVND